MHYLSLTTVFREETKWLKEWLEYHILVGVEHFYLYLHDTGEELNEVLEILKLYKNITTILYGDYQKGDFQIKAYNSALKQFSYETQWMGFIDLDEFVFPVHQSLLLPEILSHYERIEIKGLNASICTFGDSGHIFSPILQTRELIWRASDYRPCNYTAKQFFRTSKLRNYIYGGHWDKLVNEDYTRSISAKQLRPKEMIRVNHYPIRSHEDWRKKVKRGWPNDIKLHKLSEDDWIKKRWQVCYNDILDQSMLRFVPELEQKLGV